MVAALWPFPPRIRSGPYTVAREFRTDIITSRSGKEQRRALRQTPRKRVEYEIGLADDCQRAFERSMMAAQRSELIIPERTRFVTLASGIGIGIDNVTIDPVPAWIAVGASLVLMAPGQQGLRTVIDVTGTTVTFSETDAFAWPVNSRLHPALTGWLDASIRTAVVDRRPIVAVTVGFDVAPGSEWPEDEGTAFASLDGREVFLVQPDRFEPVDIERLQDGAAAVDYGFGTVERFFPVTFASRVQEAQWTACDASYAEVLRQFFTRMKGMRGEFHAPTWVADLVPLSGVATAGVTLTVEGTETADTYDSDGVYKAIALRKVDGGWINRTVSGIAISGSDSVITVTAAWGEDVALAAIDMVCWLPVWRLASDILTMTWVTETVAQVRLPMKVIENLAAET